MGILRLAYRLHSQNPRGKQVDVKHAGETIHLCCEGCADAYNENPDKYSKVERHRETHQAEHPKRKQRGEGYY